MREFVSKMSVGLVLFVFGLSISVNGQNDCSDAPNANARRTCMNMRRMDQNARNSAAATTNEVQEIWPPSLPGSPVWQQPIPVPPNSRGQIATHPYDCMTLQCLCPWFRGQMAPDGNCMLQSGQPLVMAYRKEYRMMTEDERWRWHRALTVLKQNGEYDRLSSEHLAVGQGSGAHSGPGFLPWHREYLKRVEIALRLIDPSVAIPYWDSVMDGYLPDARSSIIFSPDFAGETDANGFLVTGPFAFWRTLEGRTTIWRNLAQEGQLFTEQQLNAVFQQTNVEYVMAYTVPLAGCPYPTNYQALEYTHSNIHLWLGGDMKPPTTSANDPIFFMHHSFVDLIWENWRQLRQPRWLRETQYTPDLPQCANPLHFSWAAMVPWNHLRNSDGLSNSYTDQMYRYAPRPTCSIQAPTCNSNYLFCDTRVYPHCVAKIKLGGLCSGFEGFDACFNGQCIFGRCVPGPTPRPLRTGIIRVTTPSPPRQRPQPTTQSISRPINDCFNRNPCCDMFKEQGECTANRAYMSQYCRASCGLCTPSFNSSNECANRHISCSQWQTTGQCSGNSQMFMQENCRQSCRLCGESKNATCQRPTRQNTQGTPQKTPKPENPLRRAARRRFRSRAFAAPKPANNNTAPRKAAGKST